MEHSDLPSLRQLLIFTGSGLFLFLCYWLSTHADFSLLTGKKPTQGYSPLAGEEVNPIADKAEKRVNQDPLPGDYISQHSAPSNFPIGRFRRY